MSEPSGIVAFYIANDLTERMLSTHVDDGTGHCAGCAWQQAAQPVHPCALRYNAEVADRQKRR